MAASDFVTLRSGRTLPLAPVTLAFVLERRGFQLSAEGGDTLLVRPDSPGVALTDDDRVVIRRWKAHLLAMVSEADDVQ